MEKLEKQKRKRNRKIVKEHSKWNLCINIPPLKLLCNENNPLLLLPLMNIYETRSEPICCLALFTYFHMLLAVVCFVCLFLCYLVCFISD